MSEPMTEAEQAAAVAMVAVADHPEWLVPADFAPEARAVVAAVRPLLAAEALTTARRDISDYRIGLGRNRTQVGPKFQGRLQGLEEAAGKLTTAIKALRTTSPEKEN